MINQISHVENERKNFPATHNQVYFISAAVGPLHQKTYKAYLEHLNLLFQKGDFFYQNSLEIVEDIRTQLSILFGVDPDCFGIGPNTSHNINLLAMMLKQNHGRQNIVLPADEFPSSVLPWYHHGYELRLVESQNGIIKNQDLLNKIDSKTVAVLCSAVQFATGYRQNLIELGQKLKQKKIPFIVNATQALGAFPVLLKEAHISALTASCHKWLCAGYGASVLYTSVDFRKD